MSTIPRTIRNFFRIGPREALWQMATIGDTKAGRLVGVDKGGNRYFENEAEELPLRTRWVDYKTYYADASAIEPGWHAWISYSTDNVPTTSVIPNTGVERWGGPYRPNLTFTRGAYKPYSTVKPKIAAWEPKVAPRGQ